MLLDVSFLLPLIVSSTFWMTMYYLRWPQTIDEMLADMGLKTYRSGGNWLTWPFKVIELKEIEHLKEERDALRTHKKWNHRILRTSCSLRGLGACCLSVSICIYLTVLHILSSKVSCSYCFCPLLRFSSSLTTPIYYLASAYLYLNFIKHFSLMAKIKWTDSFALHSIVLKRS